MADNKWAKADQISDQIVDLANAELKAGCGPVQIFAGILLALMALMKTTGGLSMPLPLPFLRVREAVRDCIEWLMASNPEDPSARPERSEDARGSKH